MFDSIKFLYASMKLGIFQSAKIFTGLGILAHKLDDNDSDFLSNRGDLEISKRSHFKPCVYIPTDTWQDT